MMEREAKKQVMLFLAVVLLPMAMLIAALVSYDPLQLYHKPWGRPATLNDNMRIQAAGIIKNYKFDSVILGTSIMENYSSKLAGKVIPGHYVNLSISAGDYFERARMLSFILRKKKIRNVIYSLDRVYITARKGYSYYPYGTYEYLYDDNPFNDIKVYLNWHYLECLAKWSESPACVGRPQNLDRPNAWLHDQEIMRTFGGAGKWCAAASNYMIRNSIDRIEQAARGVKTGEVMRPTTEQERRRVAKAKRYVDKYLIEFVKRYPKVHFYFVFPPYSRALYAIWYQYRKINSVIHDSIIRYLATESSKFPNMKVYGFEDEDYSSDLANYKDLVHSNPAHDAYLLTSLAGNKRQLTPQNVDRYIAESRKKAMNYDLVGLGQELAHCPR